MSEKEKIELSKIIGNPFALPVQDVREPITIVRERARYDLDGWMVVFPTSYEQKINDEIMKAWKGEIKLRDDLIVDMAKAALKRMGWDVEIDAGRLATLLKEGMEYEKRRDARSAKKARKKK